MCYCSSKRNANYWASGSVKCTAVVTVSARWTIELAYNLTVGGVSRSHPKNRKVAAPCSPDVNQPADSKRNEAKPAAVVRSHPSPTPNLYSYSVQRTVLTSSEFKVCVIYTFCYQGFVGIRNRFRSFTCLSVRFEYCLRFRSPHLR